MPQLHVTFLSALLFSCLASVGLAAPAGLSREDVSFNDTVAIIHSADLSTRSLKKREIYFRCDDDNFGATLQQAFIDAGAIMSNMVDHLDLAIGLYKDDDSGELKDDKVQSGDRTFDENNAFNSYARLITLHYGGVGSDKNADGLRKLRATRDLAVTVQSQYANYLAGQSVAWLRGGFPWLHVYCGDTQLYSETNNAGLTYTEDNDGAANPSGSIYWLSQSEGTVMGEDAVWVPKLVVCADNSGATTRYNLQVPADSSVSAYTTGANFGLIAESIVFCPSKFDSWTNVESTRTVSGLHFRMLHVAIGSEPTDEQSTLVTNLLASGIDTTGIRWLGEFVVSTLIHEGMHAAALTGEGNTLIDVQCPIANGKSLYSTTPACQAAIAKGENGVDRSGNPAGGEQDAEMFAKYAMAVYTNAVFWYRGFRPKARGS